MKTITLKKTIALASILLITGFATYAFAHGGGYGMMSGNYMGNGGHMGYNMPGTGHMRGNFSVEDQEKMHDQMNTFFSATKDIREQVYEKQLELDKEYSKSEIDQTKIDTLRKELFDLSSRFEKERFDHMTRIQKLFAGKTTGYNRGMTGRYGGCF